MFTKAFGYDAIDHNKNTMRNAVLAFLGTQKSNVNGIQ